MIKGLKVVRFDENHDNAISIFNVDVNNETRSFTSSSCYAFTALENDLFLTKGYYSGEGDVPIIFYSGCTHAVTPFKSDFVGKITPVNKLMNGLGATVTVVGEGTVQWGFRDDFGVLRILRVNAYLVPVSKVRLLNPQSYFQQKDGESFSMSMKGIVFTFAKGWTLTVQYSSSILSISHAFIQTQVSSVGYLASTGQKNISKAQEDILLWHATSGHYNIANIQK